MSLIWRQPMPLLYRTVFGHPFGSVYRLSTYRRAVRRFYAFRPWWQIKSEQSNASFQRRAKVHGAIAWRHWRRTQETNLRELIDRLLREAMPVMAENVIHSNAILRAVTKGCPC